VIIVLKFLEIGTNKSEIMQSIVQDDNIVKALINKDADFLDTDIPDGFVRKSLIYTQVLPYKFFPNVTSSFIFATLITCSILMSATLSEFGTPDPFSM